MYYSEMTVSSLLSIGPLVQVAQHADDLDASIAFYQDVLGARVFGKFDPPGLALVSLGGVRLLLEKIASPATLYFKVADLTAAYESAKQRNVPLVGEPHLIHRDEAGQFGAPGEEEWMTFLRDPSGNLVGLVERRARAQS
jgi:catechol 2,3-dioxygenase-like lactoylglutathione lyase family enzyme